MGKDFIKLEEKMAILQYEMLQMSQEIYAQQKEISKLIQEIERMKLLLKNMQLENGIVPHEEDTPPPHY